MYFITTKRMLEVCFSAHPNIQYRTFCSGFSQFSASPFLTSETETCETENHLLRITS
ncbi:hypothetical protein HMPREF1082_04589 [[Clostridium] clostridioforme 90A7]|jgi:hypothetical protein|nr:hypothetical protein HMPREF1082_04589 [[Clostridium] clostridioforme 90A7]